MKKIKKITLGKKLFKREEKVIIKKKKVTNEWKTKKEKGGGRIFLRAVRKKEWLTSQV